MMTNRIRTVLASTVVALASTSWAEPKDTLPTLAPLVESVKAAVVNVDVQKRASDEQQALMERFFHRRGREDAPLTPGAGSGLIIDPKGLVLTNNHVVENAVTIRVRLDDGRAFDAEVVGRDPLTDVALVRLKGKFDALPSARLGDSGALKVGDWVVAIGNPFGLAQSVSAGIISALDRQIGATAYDQFLQTDAAINPGNSGGPLFSMKGEVIGINTAIIGAATGIGFAVPSNLVKSLLPQLEKQGHVTRGWLGVGIQDLTPPMAKALGVAGSDGALVSSVNENSPAQRGGVKEDDVIASVDGERVGTSAALTRLVALKRPESVVALAVVRGGKPLELKVKLGTRPDLEKSEALDKKPGELTESNQRLGLALANVDPRMADATGVPIQGALIAEVVPGSVAAQAGLRPGLVVVEANRKAVKSREELIGMLRAAKSGTVVLLRAVAAQNPSSRLLFALEVP